MKSSFYVFISWLKFILGSILSLIFLCFSTRLSLWYTIWFVAGGFYLYHNWEKAMIFSPFSGNSLILVVWIIMILKPFIKNINSPWGSVDFNEVGKQQQDNKKDFEEALKEAKNKDEIANKAVQSHDGGQK